MAYVSAVQAKLYDIRSCLYKFYYQNICINEHNVAWKCVDLSASSGRG